MLTDRIQRAYVAGARPVNESDWARLVAKAAEFKQQQYSFYWRDTPPDWRFERVVCGPGTIPVSMEVILGIELALAQANALRDELLLLAADEALHDAHRTRLLATLESARDVLAKREREARRSILSIVREPDPKGDD